MIYEINTRCWLRELSERLERPVTLANVPESEFVRWRKLGFTHVWLMGIWTSGPRARAQALASPRQRQAYSEALPGWEEQDVAGSPYAIAAYRVPDWLGGEVGLRQFREKLHAGGLKLLLDFVPNHLGLDHPWLAERTELFVQSATRFRESFRQKTPQGARWLAHGKDPYFPAWTDTVQLDYRRADTRAAMIDLLCSLAARCDGVRCDMAMLLLNEVFAQTWKHLPSPAPPPQREFWEEAIADTMRIRPDFLFLAEAYWGLEPKLQALGFDYAYDKPLYDKVVVRDPAGVQRHLLAMQVEGLARSAHFLENHDEPRIASLLQLPEHRAAALLTLTLPGMPLLHEGQLEGARIRTPVHLRKRALEPAQPEIAALYEQILGVLPDTAVRRGNWRLLSPRAAWAENPTAQNFVLVLWQSRKAEFDLAVVNLAAHRSQCYAPMDTVSLTAGEWLLEDLLSREEHRRNGAELRIRGLYLDIPAHGAQLFHCRPAG